MSPVVFKQAREAFDAVAELADEPAELLTTGQRLDQLERITTVERILPALRHELINELVACASEDELGGTLVRVLADRLRIYHGDAKQLIAEAADLGDRRAFTGEPLAPKLEHTAGAQQAGSISAEHVRIIRSFFEQLPCFVDEPSRADAERKLAKVATAYRPDELKRFAKWYESVLNPNGNFSDEDRARRRGITIGAQGSDGMSAIKGWLNPELRAGLDAVLAKWAAPGMCNPADEQPTVEGSPSEDAIGGDHRSAPHRNHDAVNAMVRSVLMSGELGSHQGLPVTITATVALENLARQDGMGRRRDTVRRYNLSDGLTRL